MKKISQINLASASKGYSDSDVNWAITDRIPKANRNRMGSLSLIRQFPHSNSTNQHQLIITNPIVV